MTQELIIRLYNYFDGKGGYKRTKIEQELFLALQNELQTMKPEEVPTNTSIPTAMEFLDKELVDDATEFGGKSHLNETLREFLDEVHIDYNTPMHIVNNALIACGIEPFKIKETYYQPELCSDNGIDIIYGFPEELHSFQVFETKEDCEEWLVSVGYDPQDFIIHEYHDNDIEGHVYIDSNGKVLEP